MESSYRWNGIDLEAVSTRPVAPVVAADSWLVRDGHTVALEKHVARFSAAAGAPPNDFWTHVVQKIPHDGDVNRALHNPYLPLPLFQPIQKQCVTLSLCVYTGEIP